MQAQSSSSPASRRAVSRGLGSLLSGAVAAAAVFGAFAAYAFLAPATYQSSAVVVVSPPMDDPVEGVQRLRQAMLAPDFVSRHSQAQRELASLDVQSLDGHRYELTLRAGSAERARELCDVLARRAADVAPKVLPAAAPKKDEPAPNRAAQELIAFLAAHPELTAVPSKTPRQRNEATDPLLSALLGERAQLEARLATSAEEDQRSDNPYTDPASIDGDVPKLRRRLAEVSNAIQARRNALRREASAQSKQPSAEVQARWQELLQAVARAKEAESEASQPTASARIQSQATLPGAPISPNRPRWLLVGALAGLGAGLGTGLLRRRRAERPSVSIAPSIPVDGAAAASASSAPSPVEDVESVPDAPSERRLREASDFPTAIWDPIEPSLLPGNSSLEPSLPGSGPTRAPTSGPKKRAQDIVEVNVPVSVREPGSSDPNGLGSEPAQPGAGDRTSQPGAAKLPLGRVTQALGSPVPPELLDPPSEAPRPFQRPTRRSTPPGSSTTYSYVSSSPPPRPISSAPPGPFDTSSEELSPSMKAHGVSSSGQAAPRSELRRIGTVSSFGMSRSATGAEQRPVVSLLPAPKDWRPDASLVPEARRALAQELYRLAVEQCFVIGVAGVRGAAEDTPRVAAELALALAETGHPRILLLEGNLQRPEIHRLMRVAMPLFSGFSEQLEARIQNGNQPRPWSVLACAPTLHVIAEGVMRIPELILSRQFEDAVSELRNYYDVIVIDGPLVSEVAACRAVQDVVDGVVLVCPKAGSSEVAEASALFSQKRFSTVLAAG